MSIDTDTKRHGNERDMSLDTDTKRHGYGPCSYRAIGHRHRGVDIETIVMTATVLVLRAIGSKQMAGGSLGLGFRVSVFRV